MRNYVKIQEKGRSSAIPRPSTPQNPRKSSKLSSQCQSGNTDEHILRVQPVPFTARTSDLHKTLQFQLQICL